MNKQHPTLFGGICALCAKRVQVGFEFKKKSKNKSWFFLMAVFSCMTSGPTFQFKLEKCQHKRGKLQYLPVGLSIVKNLTIQCQFYG